MPVTKGDDDKYTYECTVERCGFTSSNHPTKKAANERGAEHQAEHEGSK